VVPTLGAERRTERQAAAASPKEIVHMFKRNLAVITVATLVLGVGAYAWAEGTPSGPSLSSSTSATASTPAAGKHRAAGRAERAILRRAVHGDLVVKDKSGQFVTVTFDKGKVTSHSDSEVTLERPDGKSVTLKLDGSTKYRGVASASAIRDGKGALVLSKDGTARMVGQR
jgi:hypothetical protein